MRGPLLIPVFQLLLVATLSAQFGIRGNYHLNQTPYWTISATGAAETAGLLSDNGFSAGVDYWFRLKNLRIEFLPELNYAQFDQAFAGENLDLKSDTRSYSFFANTHFYILNLKGDCDCPTFSKQGPTLDKGLFIQLSPGISYMTHQASLTVLSPDAAPNAPPSEFSDHDLAFSLGAGLGMDFGLSDLFTLTPIAGIRYFPRLRRSSLDAFTPDQCDCSAWADRSATSLLQFAAGLRLGLRMDK